ncbi:MAG: hypothetical protein R3B07_19630 [Polyangiaceae bacterium]
MSPIQPKSPHQTSRGRLWLSLLVLGALWLLPSAAWAQFTVAFDQYERTPTAERSDAKLNITVSATDCKAEDSHFLLSVSGATVGNTLSVRAGTCDDKNYNDEDQCRLLATQQTVKEANFSFKIPFKELIFAKRQLVGKCKDSTQDGCTVATACTDLEDGATTAVTLTVSLDSSGVPSVGKTWEVYYDLAGPDGPTGVSLGLGEEQLKVSWKALNDSDIDGYKFFCEPKPSDSSTQSFEPMGPATGGSAGAGTAGAGGATAGAGGATAGAGGATAGAGGATAGAGGATAGAGGATAGAGGTLSAVGGTSAAGAAGTSGVAGTGGTASGSDCTASALIPGEIPPSDYECGSTGTNNATSGTVKGLLNGTKYTIGVAAVDNLGNVGTLSELACDTPEPVDDFYEVYRRAGGKGGNGYCSINQSSAPGMLGLVLAAMGALVLRRRRAN